MACIRYRLHTVWNVLSSDMPTSFLILFTHRKVEAEKICSNGFCLFFPHSLSLSWFLWLLFASLHFTPMPWSLQPFMVIKNLGFILFGLVWVYFALFFHHLKSRTLTYLNQTMILHLYTVCAQWTNELSLYNNFAWQSITITCSFIVQNTIADFRYLLHPLPMVCPSVGSFFRLLIPSWVYKILVCTVYFIHLTNITTGNGIFPVLISHLKMVKL